MSASRALPAYPSSALEQVRRGHQFPAARGDAEISITEGLSLRPWWEIDDPNVCVAQHQAVPRTEDIKSIGTVMIMVLW